jgi:hypothetical protein
MEVPVAHEIYVEDDVIRTKPNVPTIAKVNGDNVQARRKFKVKAPPNPSQVPHHAPVLETDFNTDSLVPKPPKVGCPPVYIHCIAHTHHSVYRQ